LQVCSGLEHLLQLLLLLQQHLQLLPEVAGTQLHSWVDLLLLLLQLLWLLLLLWLHRNAPHTALCCRVGSCSGLRGLACIS
jgi:hypothetical protein